MIYALLLMVALPLSASAQNWCKVGDAYYPSDDKRCWVPVDTEKEREHLRLHGQKVEHEPLKVMYLPAKNRDGTMNEAKLDRIRAIDKPVSSVPIFDHKRYCKEVGAFGGDRNYSVEEHCLKRQIEIKTELMSVFVSEEIRSYCKRVAEFGGKGGSYTIYKACVKRQKEAKGRLLTAND